MFTKAVFVVVLLGYIGGVTPQTPSPRGRPSSCDGTRTRMSCSSRRFTFNRCREYNGTIVWANLRTDDTRGRLCGGDDAWGYHDDSIWVDKGCRGVFEYCLETQTRIGPPNLGLPKCPPPRQPCCEPGQLTINLGPNYLAERRDQGDLKAVGVQRYTSFIDNVFCSQQVLVAADFQRMTNRRSCFGCVEGPYCGRRMLKIEMKLSWSNRDGMLFNIGDSVTNDGFGGDMGDQLYDAEVYCDYPNITIYGNDRCNTPRITNIENGCAMNVHTITVYVSNYYIRIINDQGLDYKRCSRCLFALNGQVDSAPGGINERIFIGLNRAVRIIPSPTRVGNGVCSATFSWACPWCD